MDKFLLELFSAFLCLFRTFRLSFLFILLYLLLALLIESLMLCGPHFSLFCSDLPFVLLPNFDYVVVLFKELLVLL